MNRYEMDKERENFRTILKKMFSITEDAASNEEIRDRILSGEIGRASCRERV